MLLHDEFFKYVLRFKCSYLLYWQFHKVFDGLSQVVYGRMLGVCVCISEVHVNNRHCGHHHVCVDISELYQASCLRGLVGNA